MTVSEDTSISLTEDYDRERTAFPAKQAAAVGAMAKKKSPRRNAKGNKPSSVADGSKSKESPALAADALSEEALAQATENELAEDVEFRETTSSTGTRHHPPFDNANYATADSADHGTEQKSTKYGRGGVDQSQAVLSSDQMPASKKVEETSPASKSMKNSTADDEFRTAGGGAGVPAPVEDSADSKVIENVKRSKAPNYADDAPNYADFLTEKAAADAEEEALSSAVVAGEVPKPMDNPPKSEFVDHITHQEAPRFADVAKHLSQIDAEEKAIDGAASAGQVPKPVQRPPESELTGRIRHHEAPAYVDAAKHAVEKENAKKKEAEEPIVTPEKFPALAEVEHVKVAQKKTEPEENENLVQQIAHHHAPSFSEIIKHPPEKAEHPEEEASVRITIEEERAEGLSRLRELDEESRDVFVSALELETPQPQQQHQLHQKPTPVAEVDTAAEIVDTMISTVTRVVEAAVASDLTTKETSKRKASIAGSAAHEEKEIFVAEERRRSRHIDADASPGEVAKRKKGGRVTLFAGAGGCAAAAIAVLGLTARYRMRKGPAAGVGAIIGVVVGLVGWMYGRTRM